MTHNPGTVKGPGNRSEVVSQETFRLFTKYRERPFVFVEPGGNFGDQLIYRGAEKLARIAGIQYESVNYGDFMRRTFGSEAVIYIHGGGGYVPWWSGKGMDALERAAGHHEGVLIQGPSTVLDDEDFLKPRIADRVAESRIERLFFLARERVSFEVLGKVFHESIELLLDHDTALNLRADDLVCDFENRGLALFAIREDKEAAALGNCSRFAGGIDPVMVSRNFKGWLGMHAEASRIVTNRLHSSIVGSIMGKPTTLLACSYHKNRSVWEHSLRDRGVTWADQLPAVMPADVPERSGRCRRLMEAARRSWLFRRGRGSP